VYPKKKSPNRYLAPLQAKENFTKIMGIYYSLKPKKKIHQIMGIKDSCKQYIFHPNFFIKKITGTNVIIILFILKSKSSPN
jgi:hypothetical protein